MSDSVVIVAPPGLLNSNAAMAGYSSRPQNELTAGSLLVTVSSTQQSLAAWLATIQAITLPLAVNQGGTGQTALGATSFSVAGSTLSARRAARMQLQWVTGAVVTADTAWFAYDPPYPGTINSCTYVSNTGTFTADVQIAGTPVTGLSALSVTGTPATTNASAANTFTAGQAITAVLTSPSGSPTDAMLSLNVTWSA